MKKNNVGMKPVTEATKNHIVISPLAHMTIADIISQVPDVEPLVSRLIEKIADGNAVAFLERSAPLAMNVPIEGVEDDGVESLFGNVRVIARGPLLLSTVMVADETEDIAHILVVDAGMVQ
jgi:hypothetical protein